MNNGAIFGCFRIMLVVVAGFMIWGCSTTPGREKPLDGGILEAVASPDGRLVAASTGFEEVALFERFPLKFKLMLTRDTDRRERARSRAPFAKPFALINPQLAFSPDGQILVASGVAGHVVAWDVRSGKEKYRAQMEPGVLGLAFFPDGREFVTVGPNAIMWDASNGFRSGELPLPRGTQAMSVAVSPDGRVTLVGLSDGHVAIFDSASRQLLRTLEAHRMPVYGVAFAPDGSMFASNAGVYDPRIWKADPNGEFTKSHPTAIGAAASAQPSQDEAQALGTLLWLLGTVAGFHTVGAPTMGAPAIGPNAQAQIAAAREQVPDPAWCPPSIAFSPDGRYLASTGSFKGQQTGSLVGLGLSIFVTDLVKGETHTRYLGGCTVAFTPDSRYLITRNTAARASPVFRDVATLNEVAEAPPK